MDFFQTTTDARDAQRERTRKVNSKNGAMAAAAAMRDLPNPNVNEKPIQFDMLVCIKNKYIIHITQSDTIRMHFIQITMTIQISLPNWFVNNSYNGANRFDSINLNPFLDKSFAFNFPVHLKIAFKDIRNIKFIVMLPKNNRVTPQDTKYWNDTTFYEKEQYSPFKPTKWNQKSQLKSTTAATVKTSVPGLGLWSIVCMNFHDKPWLWYMMSSVNPTQVKFPPDVDSVLQIMQTIQDFAQVDHRLWYFVAEYLHYYLVTLRELIITTNFAHKPNIAKTFTKGVTSIDWCYNRKDKFAKALDGYVLYLDYATNSKNFLGSKLSIYIQIYIV